jgi:hypothetical protein
LTAPESDLPAYVDAIEGHLERLRGRRVSLVGNEFALARSFHAAGVSLASVLAAIDRACEAAGPVVSLAFSSRFLHAHRRSETTDAAPAEMPPREAGPEEVRAAFRHLEALAEGLSREEWREDPTARRLLEQARALQQHAGSDLQEEVRRIDHAVDAWISTGLTGEELDRCRRELRRSLARAASSAAALDQAVRREAVRRARERLRLPRLA